MAMDEKTAEEVAEKCRVSIARTSEGCDKAHEIKAKIIAGLKKNATLVKEDLEAATIKAGYIYSGHLLMMASTAIDENRVLAKSDCLTKSKGKTSGGYYSWCVLYKEQAGEKYIFCLFVE